MIVYDHSVDLTRAGAAYRREQAAAAAADAPSIRKRHLFATAVAFYLIGYFVALWLNRSK